MVTRMLRLAGVALALAVLAGSAAAETRYVADVLVIDVREAPDPSAPIVARLRTGDAMEVLETKDGFLKVRAEDGTEGWVAAQYTSSETPKAVVIQRLQEQLEKLKAAELEAREASRKSAAELETTREGYGDQVQTLKDQLARSQKQESRVAAELDGLKQDYQRLQEQSQDVVTIAAERDALKAENQKLSERASRLGKERESLMRTAALRWFLAGAGVLLVGWAIGFSSRRRKSKFSMG